MTPLRTATIAINPDEALDVLARALGIEPQDRADNFPDRLAWRKASDTQRMIAIGEWLRSSCYRQADNDETAPLVQFNPIGGEKYAHQND